MNSKLRKVLIGITATIFVFSWIGTGYTIYKEIQAIDHYEQSTLLLNLPDYESVQLAVESSKEAEKSTTAPTEISHPTEDPIKETTPPEEVTTVEIDEYAEALADVDVSILKETNSDVVGYIIIPDTNISYPIVQGDDNDYYLRRTWDKVYNVAGCIYLDYRISAEIDDFNNIIYGHKMRNGTMFSELTNYSKQSFYEEHPSIYIITETEVRRYDIFSSYEADVKKGHTYRLGLKTDEGRSGYIEYCLRSSVIATDVTPTPNDSIITLSTCTQTGFYSYATRWVVHAALAYVSELE